MLFISTQVLITEIAHDKLHHVGHNKSYQQVLVDEHRVVGLGSGESLMGKWVDVTIESVGKFSMVGGSAVVVGRDTGRYSYKVVAMVMFLICLILLVMIW